MLFHNWMADDWRAKDQIKNPTGMQAIYTVSMLADAYLSEAQTRYLKNGKVTSHVSQVEAAMRQLTECWGNKSASSIGAPQIAKTRDYMVDSTDQKGQPKKLTRKTVNGRLRLIKEAYRLARERGLVSAESVADVVIVKPLSYGRGQARESKRIGTVADGVIDGLLPYCGTVLTAMIQLQRATAMRPGEICGLKMEHVDTNVEEGVWLYTVPPEVYKMSHIEGAKIREVLIGKRGQNAIQLLLKDRKPTEFVFSPAEAEVERRAAATALRTTPLSCGNTIGSNRKGSRARWKAGSGYTTETYRKSIEYAIKRAGKDGVVIPHWHPNQIRHNRATAIRTAFGLEAASNVLGHSNVSTTEIYAEQDRKTAAHVARMTG